MVVTVDVLMLTGRTTTIAGWIVNAFPFLTRLG